MGNCLKINRGKELASIGTLHDGKRGSCLCLGVFCVCFCFDRVLFTSVLGCPDTTRYQNSIVLGFFVSDCLIITNIVNWRVLNCMIDYLGSHNSLVTLNQRRREYSKGNIGTTRGLNSIEIGFFEAGKHNKWPNDGATLREKYGTTRKLNSNELGFWEWKREYQWTAKTVVAINS